MLELSEVDFLRMAEHDGLEAFVAGEALTANPFTPGCDLALAWDHGWESGLIAAEAAS